MFLLIQPGGKISIQTQTLDLETMQGLVGIPNEPAYIEIVSQEFSDPWIDLVCDEEFLFKRFVPTCKTPRRKHILYGQILAVGHDEEGETIGLTSQQIEIVRQQLILLLPSPDFPNTYLPVPAKSIFDSTK